MSLHLRHSFLFCLIVSIAPITVKSYAQCDQQPPDNLWSVPPNTTVYYSLDPSLQAIPPGISSPSPTQQIINAFSAWSSANISSSGNGTTFALADAGHPATVFVSSDGANGNGGATTSANQGLINSTNVATMIFHPYALITGTSTNAFQATAAGYNNAYMQAALHEIGHLMGLDHYTNPPSPSPTASVMLPSIGVNDQGNTYPKTGPTDCDIQQATRVTNSIADAVGGGGGGGVGGVDGGGGGGAPVPCGFSIVTECPGPPINQPY